MTENQEKELFTTLAKLVTGVNAIQTDVSVLKTDVQELKTDVQELKTDVQELKSDVQELKTDVSVLKMDVRSIKEVQNEHSQTLRRLEAKTDSIAETVLNHEVRIKKLENEAGIPPGRVH